MNPSNPCANRIDTELFTPFTDEEAERLAELFVKTGVLRRLLDEAIACKKEKLNIDGERET